MNLPPRGREVPRAEVTRRVVPDDMALLRFEGCRASSASRTQNYAQRIDRRIAVLYGVRVLIAMAPPVILALLAQRFIVRGLTVGALKG